VVPVVGSRTEAMAAAPRGNRLYAKARQPAHLGQASPYRPYLRSHPQERYAPLVLPLLLPPHSSRTPVNVRHPRTATRVGQGLVFDCRLDRARRRASHFPTPPTQHQGCAGKAGSPCGSESSRLETMIVSRSCSIRAVMAVGRPQQRPPLASPGKAAPAEVRRELGRSCGLPATTMLESASFTGENGSSKTIGACGRCLFPGGWHIGGRLITVDRRDARSR